MAASRLPLLLAGAIALAGLTPPSASAAAGSSLQLPPLGRHARAHASARRGPTVTAVLAALQRSGAITEAARHQYYSTYLAAGRSLRRLSGTRASELGAVLANVSAMAAAGRLDASRLPVVFLTLERNRAWWTREPLLPGGERVSFPGSNLVWEYYPGQGIQIQWLGTFGAANGYFLSGHENANLRQLLSEAIPLASRRAGGIAWEYLFQFDGGLPPWTSGLSQGTALQVLARAWSRFKDPAYLAAAQQALGIFETGTPAGVRVHTPAGALYAEYTYAPGDRILNGFIQALVGLYDYASITKDPLGLQLFEAGDAEARAEVPHYDTGSWSLYDQYGESSLNYHELLAEFLQHLCDRTRKGPPFTPAAPPPSSPPPTTTAAPPAGTPASPSTGAGGGVGASPASRNAGAVASAAAGGAGIAADQIYCTTAQRFGADLRTPPVLALLSRTLRGGTRAGVQISLSKISTVHMTVRQGSRVVWTNGATVAGGRPKLLWVTPAKGGTFTVTLSATDLAGNFATANGTLVVRAH
ncbi:MAG TPA: D-glucuronyl C5-epimerase family protein [Solirubrobacteraceae bacterium]